MVDEERLIERALSTSSACLLPQLTVDFDTKPIARDDFNEFRVMLDEQLHLLLDILYQNGNLLRDQAFDNQLVQLRVNLLILACEQIEPNPYFQTDQKILVSSLSRLTEDNMSHFDSVVLKKVVQTYKDGLIKDCWKRQLGMIYGFPKFCAILLERKPEVVDGDTMMFILSVGSKLVSHYEPHYKTIGLKIYRHMLKYGDKGLLKELNIHQVIYSESFPMVRRSSEYDYNDHLYECLLLVMSIEESERNSSRWCKFDDVIEELIAQFGLEGEPTVSELLLKKLVKLCAIEHQELTSGYFEMASSELESNYDELKAKTNRVNFRTLRWIKKLMEMMIRESPKLLNNPRILDSFHSIYIISIYYTDLVTLGQQLTDFTKKFILLLMQVARTFKDDPKVLQSIALFLKTVEEHQSDNHELVACLHMLRGHEMFN